MVSSKKLECQQMIRAIQRVLHLLNTSKRWVFKYLFSPFKTWCGSQKDAFASLGANNYELKKRRIAVTLADSRVRSRTRWTDLLFFYHVTLVLMYLYRNAVPDSGLGRVADVRNRSVRIRNLPENTQDGLLQQVFEKLAAVKRIEVFIDQNEAVVELENAAVSLLIIWSDSWLNYFYRKRENFFCGQIPSFSMEKRYSSRKKGVKALWHGQSLHRLRLADFLCLVQQLRDLERG